MDRPPEAVVALNSVLRPTPVDLREVERLSRCFAGPALQLLNLCNSSIFGLDHPIHSLEQAVISLGAEALRSLSHAWGVVHQVGKLLPASQAREFWQHNLAVALVSERIAAWRCHCASDAYVAGLLHDIGRVPLMIAMQEQQGALENCSWRHESIQAERLTFGINHCELGIQIAKRWDFSESFLLAVGNHHQLEIEGDEPELARIVSAAEALCSRPLSVIAKGSAGMRFDHCQSALGSRLPDLDPQEIRILAEALKVELLFATRGERSSPRRQLLSKALISSKTGC